MKGSKWIVVVILLLVVLAVVRFTDFRPFRSAEDVEGRLRTTMLSYMVQPGFGGSDFFQQLTGSEAEFQLHNMTEGMLYFTLPRELYDAEQTLPMITNAPGRVEFGQVNSSGRVQLGEYTCAKSEDLLFRIPKDDLRVELDGKVSISFGRVSYEASLQELSGFLRNRAIYGGYLNARMSAKDAYGRVVIFANHGALVAKPEEPSLTRLVGALVAPTDSDETKAQKLLDFVTGNLPYSHRDANARGEILKRANEVLLTGGSDCSGLAICYASLLEQANVDYRLFYLFDGSRDGHVTVAVKGDFENRNKMTFKMGNEMFSIAEATTPGGFTIGSTELENPVTAEAIGYIQQPSKVSTILDARTGKEVPFQ